MTMASSSSSSSTSFQACVPFSSGSTLMAIERDLSSALRDVLDTREDW